MHKKGFTLVELMVVIAIIAVLAAVAAPQVFRQMAKGRRAGVESFYNSVKTAANAYFSDTGRWPSVVADFTNDPGAPVTNWDGPYLTRWQGVNPWGGANTWTNASGVIFGAAAAGERWIRLAQVPQADANQIDADIDGTAGAATGMCRVAAGATDFDVDILISRDGPVN